MNIHEYQAKQLLAKYGVRVPVGQLIEEGANVGERAEQAARDLFAERRNSEWVVKAQIHAGGRGKAGGVKVCKNRKAVVAAALEIMGRTLITPQTGPEGKRVHKLWIEEGTSIDREFYFSILIDRSSARVTLLVSTEGGMEIEEVAAKHPEKIVRLAVDPAIGYQPFHGRKIASALGILDGPDVKTSEVVKFLEGIYRCFLEEDCSLIEVNPLVLTSSGQLLALDAKVNFDDNANFRHPGRISWRDPLEEDPFEIEAAANDLAYVALDGSIGCLVNGAGLAMATMDIIRLKGGAPANFLDVGGSATPEKVAEAFRLITRDARVRAILVNIFGGIMRCDVIAEGVISAARDTHLRIPLVVRLEGTNAEAGRELIARELIGRSGLKITTAENLDDAACKAVAASKGGV